MKKILLFLVTIAFSFAANAADYEIYLTGTVQPGNTGTLSIMMKNAEPIMTLNTKITIPEGITVTGIADNTDVPGSYYQNDATTLSLVYATGADVNIPATDEAVEIGTLTVTVASEIAIGDHDVTTIGGSTVMAIYPSAASAGTFEDYVSTITVQRAAIIDGLPEGYGLEVIPFQATEGNNNLNIMFKAPETIKDLEFDITLPKGMFLYDSDYNNTLPTIVDGALVINGTSVPTVTVTATDEQTAHVKVAGNKLKKTGMAAATDLVSAFTLTSYVFASGEMDETYDYVPNSIQTLKISNISMGNVAGTTTYSGKEYDASVFFGTPAETDPVVYGHYTTEGQAALKAASTNFASVDMSAATVDAEESAVAADLAGILVYGPKSTSYNRTVSNISTICLPFELTSGDGIQYYTLSEVSGSKLTFTEAATVPANTPAIFKGTIAASADGYQYANPEATGLTSTYDVLTLTGTYKSIKTTSGYYLNGGKFYQGAATVAPFRAYFDGTIAGVKAFTIALQDATGIHDITDQLSNDDIYTLQGIRVNNAQKGVNIIGGKKVYIK